MADPGSVLHIPTYSLDHTPVPICCLHSANPSPLPGSPCWSQSFSASSHMHQRCTSLAGEGSKVARMICAVFAFCKSAAALISEPLKFPPYPSWSPSWEEDSQGGRSFPLLQLPPSRGRGTNFFFFFLLSYLVTWWSFLLVYEICQCSVAILWELFHI